MAEPVTMTALGVMALSKGVEKYGEILAEKAETLLSEVVSQKWKHGTEPAKKIFSQLQDAEIFNRYFDLCIKRYLSVRTLYNLDDDAFIDEFYHPLVLRNNRLNDNFVIDDRFSIIDDRISNIIGTAGQGKTTILRKIFLCLLSNTEISAKIPFFMDLRSLKNDCIYETLSSNLATLDIIFEDEELIALLKSKKIILLLDGFDEITPDKREKILKEILHLNDSYQTQLVSTSRPGTEICTTPGINNFHVEPLTENDVFSIIKNLVSNESATQLIEALKKNTQLLSSINTPILAVLLCVCEKHLDSMPKNAKEFYNRIFNILFEGHDKTKHFYKRHRKTQITISEAKEIFCAISFISLNASPPLSRESLCKITLKAFKVLALDYDEQYASGLIDDYIDVTGLIRKDGAEIYTFVHKTIQEYHAAEFIKNSASSIKSQLISKIKDGLSINNSMLSTSVFLHHIDTENTIEELIIPLLESNGFKRSEFDAKSLAAYFYDQMLGKAYLVVKEKITNNRKKGNGNVVLRHSLEIGPFDESMLYVLAFSDNEELLSFSIHEMIFEKVLTETACMRIIAELDSVKKDGVINNKNSIKMEQLLIKTGVQNRVLIILENLVKEINEKLYLKYMNHLNERKKEKESLLNIDDLF